MKNLTISFYLDILDLLIPFYLTVFKFNNKMIRSNLSCINNRTIFSYIIWKDES